MKKVVVTTQAELDAIGVDEDVKIEIRATETIWVGKKYRSSVEARENSQVVARENSQVVAWGNSQVVAWGNSQVVAWGNSQVLVKSKRTVVSASGNARTVKMPSNINEFVQFYNIKEKNGIAVFYKAVRKENGQYHSAHDPDFKYRTGERVTAECDGDTFRKCSYGLHIAPMHWCLEFGRDWDDLAILEVEVAVSDIVLPDDSDGKVRTPTLRVLREVPLEECGLYGKILAKRRNARSTTEAPKEGKA